MRRGTACIIAMALFTSVSIFAQTNQSQSRTWTDSTGKHRIEASLVEVDGDTVVLKRFDGRVIRVPAKRLSGQDQEFLRAQMGQDQRPDAPEPDALAAAKPSVAAKVPDGLKVSATISRESPLGVIYIGTDATEKPVFITLQIEGPTVVEAVEYGRFQFSSIKDDQDRTLRVLKPVQGRFNESLDNDLVELDHFFLDRPDLLTLHFVIDSPPGNAKHVAISGSCVFVVRHSITIPDVLSHLNRPLTAPGLDKIGKFTASLPRQGEVNVKGALAIDFVGDRSRIDDVELLTGDGVKISTGGTGEGSRQAARYIRWTGEELPKDAKVRIVLKDEPTQIPIPINLPKVVIDGNQTKMNASETADSSSPGTAIGRTHAPTRPIDETKVKQTPAPPQIGIRFFQAASRGDLPTARTLLKQYPSLLSRKDPRWQGTALMKACWAGQLKIVEFLVAEGADIQVMTVDGFTPLHQAARQGHVDVVLHLLRQGADPHAMDATGGTPAEWATKDGNPRVAEEIKRFIKEQ